MYTTEQSFVCDNLATPIKCDLNDAKINTE